MTPSARKLIAVPPTIWSARRWIAKKAWMSANAPPESAAQRRPERPGVELVGAEDPEERAREHHPLEADVHDAAALGEDPAHRRERERRRVAEHRRGQRRPDDHLVEVADARAGREVAEPDPEHADHDRSPAEPARAAAGEHGDPERDGEEADQRPGRRARAPSAAAARPRRRAGRRGFRARRAWASHSGARRAGGRSFGRRLRLPTACACAGRAPRESARRRRRRARRAPGSSPSGSTPARA